MIVFRWLVVIGFFIMGWRDSGIYGALGAVIILGIILFLFYTAVDGFNDLRGMGGERTQNFNNTTEQHLHVHSGEPMPGHRDPTSPDWGAIVEIHRQGRKEIRP